MLPGADLPTRTLHDHSRCDESGNALPSPCLPKNATGNCCYREALLLKYQSASPVTAEHSSEGRTNSAPAPRLLYYSYLNCIVLWILYEFSMLVLLLCTLLSAQ